MSAQVAVIPARFASTRFPGKPLARIGGKPMVEQVYLRCVESGVFDRIIVASDDARIVEVARGFGAEAQLTSPDCASGTDRVAEVAQAFASDALLVNVQGDEPLLPPSALRALVGAFASPVGRSPLELATLVRPLLDDERTHPNVVKVVLASARVPGGPRKALLFSRADIPFQRDAEGPPPERWAHLGVYAYRQRALCRVAALPVSLLEGVEKLEQLRWLEAGEEVSCVQTAFLGLGVDTPEDLVRAEAAWAARGVRVEPD